MAKRSGKRRTGPSGRPVRRNHLASARPHRRWRGVTEAFDRLGIAAKIIISAGALAGAVTAVLTLVLSILPKQPHENVARITSVHAVSPISFSRYAQISQQISLRSVGYPHESGPSPDAAAVGQSSSPPGQSATTSVTASPSPLLTSSPAVVPASAPSPSVSAVTGSTAPSCAPSPETALPSCASSSAGTGTGSPAGSGTGSPTGTRSPSGRIGVTPPPAVTPAYAKQVRAILQKEVVNVSPPGCPAGMSQCSALQIIATECMDKSTSRMPPAATCAKQLATRLGRDTRTIAAGGQGGQGSGGGTGPGSSGKSQLLGSSLVSGLNWLD